MNRKQKLTLLRIVVTAVIYLTLVVLEFTGVLEPLHYAYKMLLFAVPYLIIGYDVIIKAAKNICHGQIFDENFLMLIASVAAFCLLECTEAVAVILLYQVGELFQSYAVGKSRQSISAMMDIVPQFANIERGGALEKVDPDEVEPGDIIVVKPGERIPLDGVVTEGESLIDTAALTGESVPRKATAGSEIVSGCINGNGTLRVKVSKKFEDSTVTKILELVENASAKKAKTENFITKFARFYTPTVTLCALLIAIIPSAITGNWHEWIIRACTFLVVSCPCALVISVPMGFFGGIGAASKIGVLIKGGNYLEGLAALDTVVFDKTGTLTKGEFKVTEICPVGCSESELIELAAYAEAYSNHPIAVSVRSAYGKSIDTDKVDKAEEISGMGVRAQIGGDVVYVGNGKLMDAQNIRYSPCDGFGTVLYVARGGEFAGTIVISDTIKEGVGDAIAELKTLGVNRCVMLTGDRKNAAEKVARMLNIDEVHASLLPGDKVDIVEQKLSEGRSGKLAFVGDGINDAPVLSRADIGIAMGSMGSDAAIEAADVVIMNDDMRKLPKAVRLSRKTVRIVKENIVFALAVKAIIMVLGLFGIANMWMAVLGDVGVAILAIINSMRALKIQK